MAFKCDCGRTHTQPKSPDMRRYACPCGRVNSVQYDIIVRSRFTLRYLLTPMAEELSNEAPAAK